ncbi:MAG: hypothetical protein Q8N15_03990 [Bacillota bacterium]|nr:hypothetical protein [Bacillota bacterium]
MSEWIYIIGGIVFGFILLGVLLTLAFAKRKKRPAPIPEERIERIVPLLGGPGNIRKASSEGGRAAFTLIDLKKADLTGVQELGATGIFVAGTTVKALFPFDVENLVAPFQGKD